MSKGKGEKARRAISYIFSGILFFCGLSLTLYPSVANFLNKQQNNAVIDAYNQSSAGTESGAQSEMWEAAREYNAELARYTPYFTEMTSERKARYESLLNPDGSGVMGYIEAEKAHIALPIYHGTEDEVLQDAIGHLASSSLPVEGESVHVVLTGHSGLPSARLFTDIDQFEEGDTFSLHVLGRTLTYEVIAIHRVLPEELSELSVVEGKELCTLITCSPYGVNTHRLAVTGRRIETPQGETAPPAQPQGTEVSHWSLWFIALPAGLFVLILLIVMICRRRMRRKKQAADTT